MCSQCDGELCYLGTLGNRDHFRCRQCGWEESAPVVEYDNVMDDALLSQDERIALAGKGNRNV